MSDEKITIRIDDWMSNQIDKICEKTGESKSVVIRALCLQTLKCTLTSVNVIRKSVNEHKYDANLLVRIDKKSKNLLKVCAAKSGLSVSEYARNMLTSSIYSTGDDVLRGETVRKDHAKKLKETSDLLIAFFNKNHKIIKNEIIKDYPFDEDVFQETFLFFASDEEAKKLTKYSDLTAHFKKRYNMFMYRLKKEEGSRKAIESNIKYTIKEDEEKD